VDNRDKDKNSQLCADLQSVCSTSAGRRVLSYIIKKGKIFEPNYIGNATIYKRAGEKDLVLGFMQELKKAVDKNIYLSIIHDD